MKVAVNRAHLVIIKAIIEADGLDDARRINEELLTAEEPQGWSLVASKLLPMDCTYGQVPDAVPATLSLKPQEAPNDEPLRDAELSCPAPRAVK